MVTLKDTLKSIASKHNIYVGENWREKVIMDTFAILNDYRYEPYPFYWSKTKPAKKVYVKKPLSYVEYEQVKHKDKSGEAWRTARNDPQANSYISALDTKDQENLKNTNSMIKDIELCDELPHIEDIERYIRAFASILEGYK